uniref:Uncharacterized protein n=1 Tax=Tetranychus urticae TaxID=32264 RepID=T1K450_TETUR
MDCVAHHTDCTKTDGLAFVRFNVDSIGFNSLQSTDYFRFIDLTAREGRQRRKSKE